MSESIWDEQAQSGELKEAINLFVWRWGHPSLTLDQAERIAVYICEMLTDVHGVNIETMGVANGIRLASIEARLGALEQRPEFIEGSK